MDDNNDIEGYSPPSFSTEGFTDGSAYTETVPDQEVVSEANGKSKPRPRKRVDHRLDQLAYERGILEQQGVFKDSVIADQNRQLQELQAQVQQKEKLSNDYFETALQEREISLVKEMRRAKEEGDIDAEIKLIEELADIKAKKNTNSLWQFQRQEQEVEKAHRINEESYVPIETSVPSYTSQLPELPEEFQGWLEDNSWYNNSPRLRQEADGIAQDLSDRLAFNNQAHLIGTPDFFQSVTNLMQSRYGLEPNGSPRSQEVYDEPYTSVPSYQTPVHTVAPVSRKGINMADQYIQNRSSYNTQGPLRSLSKEEFAIARHLPIRVRGEGEADLVRRFSKAKNYPKSPLDGGSPHRLTII